VTHPEEVDPLAILGALGVPQVTSLRRVRGGSTTAIWRVESGAATYALRVFGPGQEEVLEREVLVMDAAASGGVRVPRIHARASWRDRPTLLLTWCPGRPLHDHVLRQPWRAGSYGRAFGRVHAAIHRVKAPEQLVIGGGSWVDTLHPRDEVLRARLRAPNVRCDALIHMDYHPLNVMADGDRITGVLDWTNARAGDPRADVARTRTILRLDMGRPYLPRPVSFALGIIWAAFEWGWWHGYRGTTDPGDDMALFYAAAGSFMERDLAQRYTTEQLAHVARWTERWKRRASLPDPTPMTRGA
jgi:aminoglycoside phosphotransferase (APT) family kinase protein